jgi:hypothetical protein
MPGIARRSGHRIKSKQGKVALTVAPGTHRVYRPFVFLSIGSNFRIRVTHLQGKIETLFRHIADTSGALPG